MGISICTRAKRDGSLLKKSRCPASNEMGQRIKKNLLFEKTYIFGHFLVISIKSFSKLFSVHIFQWHPIS